MIRFFALLIFVGSAVALAIFTGGSGFLGAILLAAMVGIFAIVVTFLNEIRRVLH